MNENPQKDDIDIKKMVEDHWRSFLSFAASGSGELGKECVLRFEERIQEIAAEMAEEQRTQFFTKVEKERNLVFDEYTLNPINLKNRLGVNSPKSQPLGCVGVIVLFAIILPITYAVFAFI